MKGFIIVATLMVCVAARPDIGLNIRQGYGIPSGSYIPGASSNQGTSLRGNFGGSHGSSSNQYSSFNGGSSGGFVNGGGNGGFGNGGGNGGFGNGGFGNGGSSGGFGISGGNHQQGGEQKQVYYYDSQDEQGPQIRVRVEAAASQSNHKTIFIKAPAYQAAQIQQIGGGSAQNEEKTKVYVLIKKQEEGQDIVIPSSSSSLTASKPEVYFIKYKTQKDAEEQIQNIQVGGSGSGVSAHSVNSHSELVSSIQDSQGGSASSQIGSLSGLGGESGGSLGGGSSSSSFGISGRLGGGYTDDNHHEAQSVQTFSAQQQSSNNYGPAGASGPY